MNEIVTKYDGSLTRLTTSQTRSSVSSSPAIAGMRYELSERRALSGACAVAWGATIGEEVERCGGAGGGPPARVDAIALGTRRRVWRWAGALSRVFGNWPPA